MMTKSSEAKGADNLNTQYKKGVLELCVMALLKKREVELIRYWQVGDLQIGEHLC